MREMAKRREEERPFNSPPPFPPFSKSRRNQIRDRLNHSVSTRPHFPPSIPRVDVCVHAPPRRGGCWLRAGGSDKN